MGKVKEWYSLEEVIEILELDPEEILAELEKLEDEDLHQ